uniref:RNA-editing substrate-binding complex 6 protein domain-containing protein n=1 Tax=Chromera velia CCMP2878 TaxID=1169474 RepID=A0A0G4I740_9ALVE|eukprot:Cvel_11506.t1-p1 / transcript=Cvel_11506.t1 / gene=Cvel_11506 / organism=Chromera_velia_CCMP2878 / gene_product=hypothetical protein / transcript_product=hypothetical protein / location=Cvel_scaffold725:56305-61118(-) / protein_length=949 / sequence_SO=supercontig / SO=protein_coding / is_pseudo=false
MIQNSSRPLRRWGRLRVLPSRAAFLSSCSQGAGASLDAQEGKEKASIQGKKPFRFIPQHEGAFEAIVKAVSKGDGQRRRNGVDGDGKDVESLSTSPPEAVWKQMETLACKHSRSFTKDQVVRLLELWAGRHRRDEKLFFYLGNEVMSRLIIRREMRAADVVSCLQSFATVGIRNEALFDRMGAVIGGATERFSAIQLTETVLAFSRLNLRSTSVLHKIAQRGNECSADLTLSQIATVMYAFMHLDIPSPEFLGKLLSRAVSLLGPSSSSAAAAAPSLLSEDAGGRGEIKEELERDGSCQNSCSSNERRETVEKSFNSPLSPSSLSLLLSAVSRISSDDRERPPYSLPSFVPPSLCPLLLARLSQTLQESPDDFGTSLLARLTTALVDIVGVRKQRDVETETGVSLDNCAVWGLHPEMVTAFVEALSARWIEVLQLEEEKGKVRAWGAEEVRYFLVTLEGLSLMVPESSAVRLFEEARPTFVSIMPAVQLSQLALAPSLVSRVRLRDLQFIDAVCLRSAVWLKGFRARRKKENSGVITAAAADILEVLVDLEVVRGDCEDIRGVDRFLDEICENLSVLLPMMDDCTAMRTAASLVRLNLVGRLSREPALLRQQSVGVGGGGDVESGGVRARQESLCVVSVWDALGRRLLPCLSEGSVQKIVKRGSEAERRALESVRLSGVLLFGVSFREKGGGEQKDESLGQRTNVKAGGKSGSGVRRRSSAAERENGRVFALSTRWRLFLSQRLLAAVPEAALAVKGAGGGETKGPAEGLREEGRNSAEEGGLRVLEALVEQLRQADVLRCPLPSAQVETTADFFTLQGGDEGQNGDPKGDEGTPLSIFAGGLVEAPECIDPLLVNRWRNACSSRDILDNAGREDSILTTPGKGGRQSKTEAEAWQEVKAAISALRLPQPFVFNYWEDPFCLAAVCLATRSYDESIDREVKLSKQKRWL